MKAYRTASSLVFGTVLLLAGPSAAAAQASQPLVVHGYMSQAFAKSWQHGIAGIPTGGTLDYRAVALQIGYTMTAADRIVLQFSHRRMGTSVLESEGNQVRLDWAFYQRDLGDGQLRVGKVPLPRGLFNEIRDVGTALPFYRAPFFFYLETGETLDGVSIGQRFFAHRPWSIETEIYGGEFEFEYADPDEAGATLGRLRARVMHGGQLWLETPLPGTRIGVGGFRYRESGDSTKQFLGSWQLSAQTLYDRFFANAEFQSARSSAYDYEGWYAQAGVRVIENLTANLHVEGSNVTAATPLGDMHVDYARDKAAGLTWMVRSNTALKVEYHWFKGYAVDDWAPFHVPPVKAKYLIASVAVGF
jgi:hypothetical protein